MRSRQLETALAVFAKEVSARLQAELDEGAEVPFDLTARGPRGGGPKLYCYRPQTEAFIRERWPVLRRLPSHGTAVALLESFDGLDRYLLARESPAGRAPRRERRRAGGPLADGALRALIEDVFSEQSSFEVSEERLRGALERLDRAARASPSEITLLASLHGLTIASEELTLAPGLAIVQPETLRGVPEEALAPVPEDAALEAGRLLVAFTTEETDVLGALARGRAVLAELLRALRLFGDGRIALGRLAWVGLADGGWSARALPWGGRPHGMLVVGASQEDELRAFCSLVSRRTPREGELAWALARFEMGCERAEEHDALSDYLLALRALLEPEACDGGDGVLLAERLAALCAMPPEREALARRVAEALALERAAIEGTAGARAAGETLVRELAGHLRALLRDVICGHLDADLVGVAEDLIERERAAEGRLERERTAERLIHRERSAHEMLGDDAQTGEIANISI
jgi:hypothetical protein